MAWIRVHYEYPFGGMATRPEWSPKGREDWHRDLEMIKDTGFNLIRIRVGMDSALDEIAGLLDIAHDFGLKVEFGFATFYVPDWFVEKYPDSKTVLADGDLIPRDPLDYRWPRACIHHPEYRRLRDQIIDACAKSFKDHPSVVAWDIHNEPSLRSCYCDHTLAVYRKTLKDEFRGIEDLNRLFDTAFTSFQETMPPKSRNENGNAWRHWRTFLTTQLSEFLNEGRDIIKGHVADAVTTYNLTNPFQIGKSAQDWWNVRNYELLSLSHYCGSSANTTGRAFKLELMKALDPTKEVWIAEFQGGPFREFNLYPGKALALELAAALSHGVKGVIFYRWEPLLSGPEPWVNGMTEVDNYDTERRLTLKKAIAELREFENILDYGESRKARVGIFIDREHIIHANENDLDIEGCLFGSYALMSDLGYEADAVLDEFDPNCGYEAMVFPFTATDEKLIPAIKEYAKSGGKVLFELPTSDLDRAGIVAREFGCEVSGIERPIYFFAGWDLRGEENQFRGFAGHERLLLNATDHKTSLRYGNDGRPAVIGYEDNIILFSFPLGRTYMTTLHWGVRKWVGDFLGQALSPDIRVRGIPEEYRAIVEARVLENEEEGVLFVMNRGVYDYDVEIAVRGYESLKVELPLYSATRHALEKAAD